MTIHPEADFAKHLAEGRFMILRSASTGGCVFYPRIAEPCTGATDLAWVEASGRGTVYSTTVVRMRDPSQSYNVALIDLEEGPRMMSRVTGIAPGDVRIGMAVRAEIEQAGDGPLVVFRPA